jgi:chitin disaccharide deacetylase
MKSLLIIVTVIFSVSSFAQKESSEKIPVLIRCDDIGMCHSVNMAAKQVLETGISVSMSVMVPCPWFTEAADMLKKYPNVSVGIHLVLNSEWKNYRWGPVSGASAVPSLVDSLGNFFPTRASLVANNPKLSEMETELRAQIEKALKAGLKIDYLDYHMGAAVETLERRAIVEKLAAEYKLAISRYFGEDYIQGWYSVAPEKKLDTLTMKLNGLKHGGTKLFVMHIGLDSLEMKPMEDFNVNGPKDMSRHRNGELNALTAPSFQKLLKDPKYRLVNYRTMIDEKGLTSMKRPPAN